MPDLARRGPLGQKAPKPAKKPRKPLPPVSAKRAAYLASDDRKAALIHMGRVAEMGCFVCGARPVELHHEGKPRSDWNLVPLCPPHHRREYGPGAYHYSPKAFYALHGDSKTILRKVAERLDFAERGAHNAETGEKA